AHPQCADTADESGRLRPRLRVRPRRGRSFLRSVLFSRGACPSAILQSAGSWIRAGDQEAARLLGEAAQGEGRFMSRGRNGPRQPGGGKQIAGPRHRPSAPKSSSRHPEARGATRRASKEDGPGRSSSEARQRRASQDDGASASPAPAFSQSVQTVAVTPDENGMRVDRFFEARFPGLSFSHIQRIVRKGEVRVDGKRTEPKARLKAGQSVRIPPLKLVAPPPRDDAPAAQKDRGFLKS